jgi:predicted transcriptional regulator
MDQVWDRGEVATVRDIFDQLSAQRRIAYTTVMSTMDNLHRKGWLARERVGKAYQYWPTLTREEHSAQLMRDALEGGGDTALVLTFFLEQMDAKKSAQVRAALRRIVTSRRRA